MFNLYLCFPFLVNLPKPYFGDLIEIALPSGKLGYLKGALSLLRKKAILPSRTNYALRCLQNLRVGGAAKMNSTSF